MRTFSTASGCSAIQAVAAAAALLVMVAVSPAAQGQGASAGPPAGDPARGKAVVQSGGCLDCHRIGDRGSHAGPDLTELGSRRTPDRLRQALVDPDEEVLPENRYVRLVAKDGTVVTGRLLNQDAMSVQLITTKDELKSYLRASLREFAIVQKGLMPSVRGKLTDQQVADVVAYLSTLKAS